MQTKDIKAQIDNGAERIERGVRMAAEKLSSGTESLAAKVGVAEDKLRDYSSRFMGSAKELTAQAREQARLHPLAAFGIAFAAGVIVARVLRR